MDRLLKRIHQVCPAAFCSQDFFLLHDNAPTHKAARVCQFLTQKIVTTLFQPLNSPALSLPDYFLFPKLKMKLKELHFVDVAEIQEAITGELKEVQKEDFLAAFQKLSNCTKACIYASRAYFELKKKRYVSSSCFFDFLKKKSFLKLLDHTVGGNLRC